MAAESHEPNGVWEIGLLMSEPHVSVVNQFACALGSFHFILLLICRHVENLAGGCHLNRMGDCDVPPLDQTSGLSQLLTEIDKRDIINQGLT